MELGITHRSVRGWTLLSVSGDLDLHTSPSLHSEILSCLASESLRVAVDLTGVGFMDSAGLGVLVAAASAARERVGEFCLVGVTGSPARVLALTGMDDVFAMVDSPERLPAGRPSSGPA